MMEMLLSLVAPSVIDGPSGDSTGFVGLLFASLRFLAVCVFLLIGVLFIFLSLLFFQIYVS